MSPAIRASQDQTSAPPARSLRVLVVDDSHDTVLTTMALLRDEGYDTNGCYSGTEVMPAVREYDPDVVLLDLALPGESGWELARQIRSQIYGKRPMLIAITGEYTKTADKILSEMNGFDYYLVKPADPKVLFALLDKARE